MDAVLYRCDHRGTGISPGLAGGKWIGDRIAIVDDNQTVRCALARLLTSEGCEVETFGSAQEARGR